MAYAKKDTLQASTTRHKQNETREKTNAARATEKVMYNNQNNHGQC